MSLGNNLLDLRKKRGLSQEEVAEMLNVSRQTVSKWETDQSQPDFDKIKPLCELYNITADELLFEKKDSEPLKKEESVVQDDGYRRRKKAQFIGLGIFLYFVSVVWIMLGIPVMRMDPIVASSIFLIICGIATSVIVYACLVYKKNDYSIKNNVYKSSPVLKSIYMIVSLIFIGIYLYVSFKTLAWHITWIIWIIYSIVIEVIKLTWMLLKKE